MNTNFLLLLKVSPKQLFLVTSLLLNQLKYLIHKTFISDYKNCFLVNTKKAQSNWYQ
jgi:hypothetical protein